ncbi:unnamed protein product [Eruca vesicaria subsp. sativa]|uniref:Uncharacterized protein n=1 Tax=Eruca vesicaria subsp. sativa TaxID=29727 RepID=A0ABC8IUB5_ERUVS|nr:unnamed protein product [Eruca vesicaria subsp. sativa]
MRNTKNLLEESYVYWEEIQNGTFKFNRIDEEVAALRELKKEELIGLWKPVFEGNGV